MRKLIFAAALSLVAFNAFAIENSATVEENKFVSTVQEQDFEEINVADLPEAVVASFQKSYPSGTIAKAYKNDSDQFKLEVVLEDGTEGTLYADAEGNWIDL